MPHFLLLPLEVRTLIYEHCLSVGKVFPYSITEIFDKEYYGYNANETEEKRYGYEVPDLSILRVCKATQKEAEPILYRKNTIILPICGLSYLFFETFLKTPTRHSWVSLFRSSYFSLLGPSCSCSLYAYHSSQPSLKY